MDLEAKQKMIEMYRVRLESAIEVGKEFKNKSWLFGYILGIKQAFDVIYEGNTKLLDLVYSEYEIKADAIFNPNNYYTTEEELLADVLEIMDEWEMPYNDYTKEFVDEFVHSVLESNDYIISRKNGQVWIKDFIERELDGKKSVRQY